MLFEDGIETLCFYSDCFVSFESLPGSSFALFDSLFFFLQIFAELYIVVNRLKHTATLGRSKYFLFTFLFIIFFLLLLLLPFELSWKWLNWSRNRNLGWPRMNGQIRVSASPWSFRFNFKVTRFVHIMRKKNIRQSVNYTPKRVYAYHLHVDVTQQNSEFSSA